RFAHGTAVPDCAATEGPVPRSGNERKMIWMRVISTLSPPGTPKWTIRIPPCQADLGGFCSALLPLAAGSLPRLGGPESLLRSLLRPHRLDLAIARRRRRHHRIQQPPRDHRDLVDRPIERCLIRVGRMREA